jgi:hypothetical protein
LSERIKNEEGKENSEKEDIKIILLSKNINIYEKV